MLKPLALPVGPGGTAAPRREAKTFAVGLALLTALECALALAGVSLPNPWTVVMWALAAFGGQLLSFDTPTGRGRTTLAVPIHLAMAVLLTPSAFLPAIWMSRLGSTLVLRKRDWTRMLFRTAQVSLSVLAAHTVYRLLLPGFETAPESGMPLLAPAYALLVFGYYAVNMSTVGCLMALSTGGSWWRPWSKGAGIRVEILSALGFALLGPLLILGYRALGGLGLVLFLLPMVFVWKATLEVMSLKREHAALVASERQAERSELALEVGTEINQYLTQIYGQVQLMLRNQYGRVEMERRLGLVLGELGNISAFTKSLTDTSRRPTVMVPTDLCHLVESMVSGLRLQGLLEDRNIYLDLDEGTGAVYVDPLQVQQAVRNLILNALEAAGSVWVSVRLQDPSGRVEIAVADDGPGIPETLRPRILEAGFSTKPNARGMGLSTTYRTTLRHEGQLLVEASREGGAMFRIVLPASLRSRDARDETVPDRAAA
jgi:signal transduction histidine kinase